jgi:hypothetical protein
MPFASGWSSVGILRVALPIHLATTPAMNETKETTKDFTFAKLSDLDLPVTFRMYVYQPGPPIVLLLITSVAVRNWKELVNQSHSQNYWTILN